jgi:hypothetical protein
VTLPGHPTPAAGISGTVAEQDLPFPPAPIEELLRSFVKAVRAHQLYLPNNPVYKGAIDTVRAGFPPIWDRTDELVLRFSETDIRWLGRPVLTETTKSADSLPWTFFKDGVREVQFLPGFEQEELVKLFDILQRVRKASPDEDDLLTLLWQADFTNLRYRYVDVGAEPGSGLADGSQLPSGAAGSAEQVRAAMEQESEQSRSAVVSLQDFDATLYFLDEKELEYLRQEIDREYSSDLRHNVLSILFDIYEAQAAPEVREEVSELIETLMLMLLAAGQLRTVAFLLSETQVVAKRAQSMTPEQVDRLGRLPERLSTAEPLGQLLQAIDESADLPAQEELTHLFEQLRPAALATVFTWIPRLQNPKVRPLLETAADRLASANTGELVKLINTSDTVIAREATRRAGALKTAAAVAPLARLLVESKDTALRQLAVQALSDIGTAGAMQGLEKSIEDPDRDVRIAAVRTLGTKGYRGVFNRLEAVVKGKAIRTADLTERTAFFEAYGALCGDAGVPFLDGILNAKGMFGSREEPEIRACAAIALGRIASKKAQESLQRAAGEKDVIVRTAVSRALKRPSTSMPAVK